MRYAKQESICARLRSAAKKPSTIHHETDKSAMWARIQNACLGRSQDNAAISELLDIHKSLCCCGYTLPTTVRSFPHRSVDPVNESANTDRFGRTPLHRAARDRKIKHVKVDGRTLPDALAMSPVCRRNGSDEGRMSMLKTTMDGRHFTWPQQEGIPELSRSTCVVRYGSSHPETHV